MRRSIVGRPVLSAIARHGEPPLQGAVGQAGDGGAQVSGVSSHCGGGKAPGCVAQEPPPLTPPLSTPLLVPLPLPPLPLVLPPEVPPLPAPAASPL
jgi:hypothetical protein